MKKRRLFKMTSVILSLFLLASCAAQPSGFVSSAITESEEFKTESIISAESDIASVGISQNEQQTSSVAAEDLNSDGKKRANKLMAELKNIKTDIIRFYSTDKTVLGSVGFSRFSDRAEKLQPHNVIDGSNQIEKFMASLKLDKWTAKKFNLRSMPEAIIYMSKDLHINLEAQHQGISWMSINSAENANVYFVVPNDVYNELMGYIKYDKVPENAIGYYAKLTAEELNVAENRLNAIKNSDISSLNIYYDSIIVGAGFRTLEKMKGMKEPTKIINDSDKIKEIISCLEIEKWNPVRFNPQSYSEAVLYISNDIHINLEGQKDGKSWISINSEGYVNIYYLVPDGVYQNLLETCADSRIQIA